jgi:hypothetical protein
VLEASIRLAGSSVDGRFDEAREAASAPR